MKKLFSVFFFCCFFVLIFYFLLGGFEEEIAIFLESQENINSYSILSFLVLSLDIFVPVPSSLVMILNGRILGIFPAILLSTTSGLLSSTIGFYIGRKSEPLVDLFFSQKEKNLSSRIFLKYGKSAILFSKALPIVSEALSFLSGTTAISFKMFFFYSFVGHMIISAVYAYAGNFSTSMDSNFLSAGIIIIVLFLFWIIEKLLKKEVLSKE